jgi:hypothetical protein
LRKLRSGEQSLVDVQGSSSRTTNRTSQGLRAVAGAVAGHEYAGLLRKPEFRWPLDWPPRIWW